MIGCFIGYAIGAEPVPIAYAAGAMAVKSAAAAQAGFGLSGTTAVVPAAAAQAGFGLPGAIAIGIVATPDRLDEFYGTRSRLLTVPVEQRRSRSVADNRTILVGSEQRTIVVPRDPREA